MCVNRTVFSLCAEKQQETGLYSSSSLWTHPVFTQNLACVQQLAVGSGPTCSSFWDRQHQLSAEKESRSCLFFLQQFSYIFFSKLFFSFISVHLPLLWQSVCCSCSLALTSFHPTPCSNSLLSWLCFERKLLLYYSQTSGDLDPLIFWYNLCSSGMTPHLRWL